MYIHPIVNELLSFIWDLINIEVWFYEKEDQTINIAHNTNSITIEKLLRQTLFTENLFPIEKSSIMTAGVTMMRFPILPKQSLLLLKKLRLFMTSSPKKNKKEALT